jgi:hypothetical protein
MVIRCGLPCSSTIKETTLTPWTSRRLPGGVAGSDRVDPIAVM